MLQKLVDFAGTSIFSGLPLRWTDHEDISRAAQYLDSLKPQLHVTKHEDWYRYKMSQVLSLEGSAVLREHGKSLHDILKKVYPGHRWAQWAFADPVPNRFWADRSTHRAFLDWFMKQKNMTKMEDWYSVKRNDVLAMGGRAMLARHKESLSQALKDIYTDHNWIIWKFDSMPSNFWADKTNHRKFVRYVESVLGITELDDWYKISRKQFEEVGGVSLLAKHDDSFVQVLRDVHPQHEWREWKFTSAPNGFWNSLVNQRRFFEAIKADLGVRSPEDWYRVDVATISKHGGTGMISKHRGSLSAALRAVYPKHYWDDARFAKAPNRTWSSVDQKRAKLEHVAKELGVKTLDDWYNISRAEACRKRATGMLEEYKGSLVECLKSVYPSHPWLEWRFRVVPTGFWASVDNQRKYFVWLRDKLEIKDYEDWYSVDAKIIKQHRGGSLITMYYKSSVEQALRTVFPEHEWVSWKFGKQPRQWRLDH